MLGVCLTVAVLLIEYENKSLWLSLDKVLVQAFSFSALGKIPLLPQS